MNAIWWTRLHDNLTVMLKSNSGLAIRSAELYWKTCAVIATVVLGTVNIEGWWYQRRLGLVKDIANPHTDQ
jgi:hypothetical protein